MRCWDGDCLAGLETEVQGLISLYKDIKKYSDTSEEHKSRFVCSGFYHLGRHMKYIQIPTVKVFNLLAIALLSFAPVNAQANNLFKPTCADDFKDVTFSTSTSFEVELNVNEPGPCDWHKDKPNFGDFDFFSENYLTTKQLFGLDPSLTVAFSLSGLSAIQRGNFIEIRQTDENTCAGKPDRVLRIGKWEDDIFISTTGADGKNAFQSQSLDNLLESSSQLNFTLNVKELSNKEIEVKVEVNGRSLFKAVSHISECEKVFIRLGLNSFGRKKDAEQIVSLGFANIKIEGKKFVGVEQTASSQEVRLTFAHLLENDSMAVCNDGTPASFFSSHALNSQFPDKTLIAFEGGGAALSLKSSMTKYAEAYDRRPQEKMTSAVYSLGKSSKTLSGYFRRAFDDGWGIVFLPYCSSDLHMGDHELKLDGRLYQVRGRRIVKALYDTLQDAGLFHDKTDLLLVGGSAGDIAISGNLDLVQLLPKQRLRLLFTIWQVPAERAYVDKKQASQFNKLIPYSGLKFTHGNVPKHCTGTYSACGPNLENISRFKFDDYFIEGHWKELPGSWSAYTTRHMTDKKLYQKEMRQEVEKAGGGFALIGDTIWKTGKKFNHVMSNTDKQMGEPTVVPIDIVWNWISGTGETRYIGE